jgi:hypothetical protein
VTVRAFWERWTTDHLFARPKQSSDIRRREQTKAFVDRYGETPLVQIGDELGLPRKSEFCFVSLRGEHWTPSSRAYHWKAVRAAAGWHGSPYLATRHFACWYMVKELEMPSEDVAIALGHQDGGNLVRRLYGHRDKRRALDRIVGAYATRAENRPKRPGSSSGASHTSPQESLF